MSVNSVHGQNAVLAGFAETEFEIPPTHSEVLSPLPSEKAVEAKFSGRTGPQLKLIKGFKKDPVQFSLRKKTYLQAKLILDVFAASMMLVFAAPLMALTYLAIKIASPGPAILKQKRLTLNGRSFTIYKFRTMRTDAERYSGAVMAGENDPRIYPLGKFLRKSRLDELPQLINVLKGDMSLVGPRPERPEIAVQLEKELPSFYRRTYAKAGLTGLAQVEHGYCSSVDTYRRKLAFDILYVKKQSLLLDAVILFKTISVVLFFRGAR